METKILLDYEEYQRLRNIERVWMQDKSEEDLDNDKAKRGKEQQGFGELLVKEPVEEGKDVSISEISNKVFQQLKRHFDKDYEKKVDRDHIRGMQSKVATATEDQKNLMSEIQSKLSTKVRHRGSLLLRHLLILPDFQIHDSREISLGGSVIQESDILKLLRFVLGNTQGKSLLGKDEFVNYLVAHGLQNFIRNKNINFSATLVHPKEKIADENKKKAMEFSKKWYCLA